MINNTLSNFKQARGRAAWTALGDSKNMTRSDSYTNQQTEKLKTVDPFSIGNAVSQGERSNNFTSHLVCNCLLFPRLIYIHYR